ncbi:MAG: SprT family zinc-dependent metalloprotease [Rhodospirillales bacterium]
MARKAEVGSVLLGGQVIPLRMQWQARARRVTMTLDHTQRCLRLVLPPSVGSSEALAFCRQQEVWVLNRWAALPRPIPFAPGSRLPLHGEEAEIRHCRNARRGVWREPGALNVSGPLEHLPRRVETHCRAEAQRLLQEAVRAKAARIDRRPGRVSLRASRSRWGSCSPKGDLSFCWRLVFAPPEVLDYVAAHEVAHLAHMNHSPAFWRVCAELVEDIAGPRRWLAKHGASLWRYGSGMETPGTQM